MLDKRTELMLQMASTLTAEDIAYLREGVPHEESVAEAITVQNKTVAACIPETPATAAEDVTRGERERLRTRESKVSTSCVGQQRTGHEWWPVGTELIGRIGCEEFTASVVENTRVKSGRSIQISSGPLQGKVCITPTRAALDATEAFRQSHQLGRAGGVTNGWTFWKTTQS